MTTSASPNILKAIEVAKNRGMITFLINKGYLNPPTGLPPYKQEENLRVGPVPDPMATAEIQNQTIQYLHVLAYEIKRELIGEK